jgi:RND family efflux transporter MFP subunit
MKSRPSISKILRVIRTVVVGLVFTALVIVLMIWLAGGFREKINPATAGTRAAERYTGATTEVRRVTLPQQEEAVGSVKPVHEMVVTSRVAAKIVELQLTAGQNVAKDEIIVRLDDRDMQARVKQAKAGLESANAIRAQATIDRQRLADALTLRAASKTEFDAADLALKNAEASVTRATEQVNEAQAALEYATIRAPMSGIVVDRKVNVGDTIMPGQVLATLYDPTHMQLIASVRETLTQRLKVGQPVGVRMDALGRVCPGNVSEIVPEAESASRTFQVKVTGPCPPGIYSGMFGRIIIPMDAEEVLLVAQGAVSHVGQLDLVDVVHEGQAERRIVRLGRQIGDDVEVLSGLAEGEHVALRNATSRESTK